MAKAEYLLGNEKIEVGYAQEFQDSARNSKVVTFENDTIKLALYEADPKDLLVVSSTINSPKKIISVEKYNQNFIRNAIQ